MRQLCTMLIDDDQDDNFYHEREIAKNSPPRNTVIVKDSGRSALEYLKAEQESSEYPDLIFLDINMPRMNGWEFLQEYKLLSKDLQRAPVIIMLSTSASPSDMQKAKDAGVSDYITKPLTVEVMKGIVAKYLVEE